MHITVDIVQLLIASIPIWLAIFGGCWVLMRALIFKPLNEISKDLKAIKRHIFSHDERISVIETKIKLYHGED